MNIRLSSDITIDSIVDGPGLRTVIWTQGCTHKCPGCHNPETHSLNGGCLVSVNDLIERILNQKMQSGVTFSGGDPFEQPEACAYIASKLKINGIDLWAYTGYTFEYLLNIDKCRDFLNELNVLVDGRFQPKEKDLSLPFRGSRNQRIIDVPESLKQGKTILVPQYINSQAIEIYHNKLIFAY